MILVTGGTGLVGSHLLYQLLLNNDTVKAIHQKSSDLKAVKKVLAYYTSSFEVFFKKIIWVEAELNDIPALEIAFKDVSFVYHCAAFVSFDPRDYIKMRKINIDGTTNIVNLCISHTIKKLCFVSSIATIEKNENNLNETYNSLINHFHHISNNNDENRKSTTINLIDGLVSIIYKTTNTLDGKINVKDFISNSIDGKTIIKSVNTNLLDGKINIKNLVKNLFDSKIIIKSITTNLLDGKVIIKNSITNLFDSKIDIKKLTTWAKDVELINKFIKTKKPITMYLSSASG